MTNIRNAKENRQGKRRPGTVLISYPAPMSEKAELEAIAKVRTDGNLAALMRQIQRRFLAKHRAAKRMHPEEKR